MSKSPFLIDSDFPNLINRLIRNLDMDLFVFPNIANMPVINKKP